MQVSDCSVIACAHVARDALASAAPSVCKLAGQIGAALLAIGVLGDDVSACRGSEAARDSTTTSAAI